MLFALIVCVGSLQSNMVFKFCFLALGFLIFKRIKSIPLKEGSFNHAMKGYVLRMQQRVTQTKKTDESGALIRQAGKEDQIRYGHGWRSWFVLFRNLKP